jgi:hypothetical protein
MDNEGKRRRWVVDNEKWINERNVEREGKK